MNEQRLDFTEEVTMTVVQTEATMVTKQRIKLFVDRNELCWVVMDSNGQFWTLPTGDNPWENRKLYQPSSSDKLEPVPGHYKTMLGVPG
ncbi:MAG: hypothetical protein JNJ77_15830 [Planctomycetia bacterium]|nr:hypothetical protein [Planctomycetia bacterium]